MSRAMRVFLDTNILVDVLLDRKGLASESAAVIARCESLAATMLVAWHGLATAFYLLKRGRSQEEALQEVDKILAWATVASCGDADARRARALGFPDFEDALQAVAAEAGGAACIVTRNTADFRKSGVPALSPSDFLAKYPEP